MMDSLGQHRERHKVLRDLQFTSNRLGIIQREFLAFRRSYRAAMEANVPIVSHPEFDVMPSSEGMEVITSYLSFQNALKKIVDFRILDIRAKCGRALNWSVPEWWGKRDSPDMEITASLDEGCTFERQYSTDELSVLLQAEAVLWVDRCRHGDIESLVQWFLDNSLQVQNGGEQIMRAFLHKKNHPEHRFLLEEGARNYFDRPDIFVR